MFAALSCRLATILAMAVWWGGLTFYALVVVPTGGEVLGGDIEQGFITRQVSKTINLLGSATLVVLLWNTTTTWRTAGRRAKYCLTGTWVAMAGSQLVLFVVHPQIDALLNVQTHEISDPSWFHFLHEFYVSVVGVEWLAGLLYLVTAVITWRAEDISR